MDDYENMAQQGDETFAEFERNRYIAHLQDNYYGAMNIFNVAALGAINPTYLWAATTYQVCAYAENIYGNASEGVVVYFSTAAADSKTNWEVTAIGTTTTGIDVNVIRDIVSEYQGVNPERNLVNAAIYTAATAPAVTQTYKYTGTIINDRSKSSPTTATIASLSSDDMDDLYDDLEAQLGSVNFTVSGY